jgi:hypothetical protein
LWVFRDGKQSIRSREFVLELQQSISTVRLAPSDSERKLDALIRAGELEAALADQAHPAAGPLTKVTDAVAASLASSEEPDHLAASGSSLNALELPEKLLISTPEGFAYYALHPMDFAETAARLAQPGGSYAVIGIRSIGTTLAAVVTAALQKSGVAAERITVRPVGHPYDRSTNFTAEQIHWVQKHNSKDALFLVVDEGPGLSGSSFLSVGEALLNAGVQAERVTFVGSRDPDVKALCTHDAANRWSRFQWRRVTGNACQRFPGSSFLEGGAWRTALLNGESDWPASWTQMERLKILSADRKWLLKFEGLGRFGREARERALCLHDAGFGCDVQEAGDGLLRYPFLQARPLSARDLSAVILERIAEYCAFRARDFRVNDGPAQQLEEMVRVNLAKEFTVEVAPQIHPGDLITNNPVLSDGRMQPHEWLLQADGRIFKTDAISHGDDHFFPGPADIAWDLAGAAVEWQMDSQATDFLLARFAHLTGDDPRPRFPAFLLAYSVFRMGYCKLALSAEAGSPEEIRLRRAYQHYRGEVQRQLALGDEASSFSVVSEPSLS